MLVDRPSDAAPEGGTGETCRDPLGACATAARGALSNNTERALRSDLAIYKAWCKERGECDVPASPETIATFVDVMGRVRAPATVRRYVASIRPYSSHFRVVGSTNAVDARDNTSTTYTATDKGVAIYWLNGSKVADDYEDFYDGSWDNWGWKNQSGRGFSFASIILKIATGSDASGTEAAAALGEAGGFVTANGSASGNPFADVSVSQNHNHHYYALSPVFKIRETVGLRGAPTFESTPANAMAGYAAGETIKVRVTFTESVNVTGTPHLFLNIGGAARKAVYSAGSGTENLDFTYTVQAADFDSDGVKLCESTSLDPGCGGIRLGGSSILAKSDGLAPASLDLPRRRGPNTGHKVDGTPMTFTPMPGTGTGMVDASTGEVPSNWALLPSGVERGRKFRLLFRTSTTHTAESDSIATYNAVVQTRAGLGHSAIRAFKGGFGVIGCTATDDAVENTGTAVVNHGGDPRFQRLRAGAVQPADDDECARSIGPLFNLQSHAPSPFRFDAAEDAFGFGQRPMGSRAGAGPPSLLRARSRPAGRRGLPRRRRSAVSPQNPPAHAASHSPCRATMGSTRAAW